MLTHTGMLGEGRLQVTQHHETWRAAFVTRESLQAMLSG